jgi:YVTN family beta-propeller protein
VADSTGNRVDVISTPSDRIVAEIPVGYYPQSVAWDPDNGRIFVSNLNSDNVTVISDANNEVIASIPVGVAPNAMVYDPDSKEIFVANSGDSFPDQYNVTVVSTLTDTTVANVPIGSPNSSSPQYVAFDNATGDVYVSNAYSNNLTVISGQNNTFVANVSVGLYAEGVAYDSMNGEIYVGTEFNSNGTPGDQVTVIDGNDNTVVSHLGVGLYPEALAYDAENSEVLVTNTGSDTVTLINGSSNDVTANVSVGSDPMGITAGLGNVYVTNYGSGTVNILSPPLIANLTFYETGLAAGTTWSVSLNGTGKNSSGDAIRFTQTFGNYSFVVQNVSGYDASPSSGVVLFSSGSSAVNITFRQMSREYSLTFGEAGLPPGLGWGVHLDNLSNDSQTSEVSFLIPNGTFEWVVDCPPGLTVSPSGGAVTIDGGSQWIHLNFFVIEATYNVTFLEDGLGVGVTWSITLNSTILAGPSGTALVFTVPNGSFAFQVISPGGFTARQDSGEIVVDGVGSTISIDFFKNSSEPTTFLGWSGEYWFLFLTVIVVAGLGTFVILRRKQRRSDDLIEQEPGSSTGPDSPDN